MTQSIRTALLFVLTAWAAQGSTIYQVSLDTSQLIGHPAGLFALNFQLNDGSGTDDGNNTASLSNFLFGGGSASGTASLFGGAAGSLETSVTLTDSSFFNAFTQSFVAGTQLKFFLELTTNDDTGGTPDQFSFAILDSSGFEIPTQGPFNALLVIDLAGSGNTVQAFPTDSTIAPNAGGNALSLGAPDVGEVPEPASGFLCLAALITAGGVRHWRLRSRTSPMSN